MGAKKSFDYQSFDHRYKMADTCAMNNETILLIITCFGKLSIIYYIYNISLYSYYKIYSSINKKIVTYIFMSLISSSVSISIYSSLAQGRSPCYSLQCAVKLNDLRS